MMMVVTNDERDQQTDKADNLSKDMFINYRPAVNSLVDAYSDADESMDCD